MPRKHGRSNPKRDDIEEMSLGSSVSNHETGIVGRSKNAEPRTRKTQFGGAGKGNDFRSTAGHRPFMSNFQIVEQPQGHTKMWDGGEYATMYGSNTIRGAAQTLVTEIQYPEVHWDTFQATGSTVTDVPASTTGTVVSRYFQEIVNVINFNGRFTPNQVLTATGHWATWLNDYTEVLSIVRGCEAIMASAGLNGWFKVFGSAFNAQGNFDRVMYLRERLEKIPFPPKLRAYLDRMFGVFGIVDDDMWIVAMINDAATTTAVTTLTSATEVATLLTRAETILPDIEGTGTIEANIINQVLAMVYGPPAPFPAKTFDTDPTWYDMHYMQAGQIRDTQAALTYINPQSTGAAGVPGIVPIPVRYGCDAPHLLSILRPSVYQAGAQTGVANASPVGLVTFPSNHGTFARVYKADIATTAIVTNEVVTAGLTPFSPVVDGYGFWWTELSVLGATGLWQNDTRRYDRWDEYYVGTDRMASATRKYLDQLILVDVHLKPLR